MDKVTLLRHTLIKILMLFLLQNTFLKVSIRLFDFFKNKVINFMTTF